MARHLFAKFYNESGEEIKVYEEVSGRGAELLDYQLGVKASVDSASGKITGGRQYLPIKIEKPICPASPELFRMITQGKKLKKIEISVYRHNHEGDGTEELYYRTIFDNVTLASLEQKSAHGDNASANSSPIPFREVVSFFAEQVENIYEEGHLAFKDVYLDRETAA